MSDIQSLHSPFHFVGSTRNCFICDVYMRTPVHVGGMAPSLRLPDTVQIHSSEVEIVTTRPAALLAATIATLAITTAVPANAGLSKYIPKSSFIEDPPAPPTLNIQGSAPGVNVVVAALISAGGEGSWYRESKWDEYVVTITNRTTDSLDVNAVRLVDPRGVFIACETEPPILISRTEKLMGEYDKLEYGALGMTALSGAAFLAVAPVALVAGPAYYIWRTHVYNRDQQRLGAELKRRTISLPTTLAAGATATTSYFFPIVPSPRALVIDYKTIHTNAAQATIALTPLKMLHLSTGGTEHPATVAARDSTSQAAPVLDATPTEPSTLPAATQTPEERLKQLKELFSKGLISKPEYDKKRAEILASM